MIVTEVFYPWPCIVNVTSSRHYCSSSVNSDIDVGFAKIMGDICEVALT